MSEKQKDCGALWENTSKNGAKYMSGSVEFDGVKHKIVVFRNTFKEQDKHPDFKVYPSTPQGEAKPEEAKEDEVPF